MSTTSGMRYLMLGLCLLFAQATFAQKSTPAPPQRVIDMHMHVYSSDDARWKAKVPNPITNQPMVATNEQAHRQATVAQMDRHHVTKALISGDYDDFDAALRWKEKAPDRFIVGIAFEDPEKVDLERLRKEAQPGRLQPIGEIAPQYEGIAPLTFRQVELCYT